MQGCEQSVWTGNVLKVVNGGFKWGKEKLRFDEEFCEADIKHPKKLNDIYVFLLLLPKRMKNNCNLYNKRSYAIHLRTLNWATNHGLRIKKVRTIIGFYQNARLKPSIDLNVELRAKTKNYFKKDLFNLMQNSVFGKTMGGEYKEANRNQICDSWQGKNS